jgi:hypothetical protein
MFRYLPIPPISESLCMRLMEQYDDTFEPVESVPTIKEIEKRLRRLGCTKEQVSRHLEQVTKGRTKPAPKRSKNRPHRIDWP